MRQSKVVSFALDNSRDIDYLRPSWMVGRECANSVIKVTHQIIDAKALYLFLQVVYVGCDGGNLRFKDSPFIRVGGRTNCF